MNIASLVIGIIAICLSLIPCVGIWAIFPAIIGGILGVIDLCVSTARNKPKGMAISGTILSALALVIAILNFNACGQAVEEIDKAAKEFDKECDKIIQQNNNDLKKAWEGD